jgi:hypothetical protein
MIVALSGVAMIALAGCTPKHKPPAPVAEQAPPSQPSTPARNALRAANSGLSGEEAAWHLRSALNVAALACDRSGKLGIASDYNQLLARQRAPLAAAYRAEGARFAGAGALDAHVTRLYNQFAQPPAQAHFCAVAAQVAAEARAVPPERFIAYAPDGLARLVASFDERPASAMRMASTTATAATAGPPWRIQLGAYSGSRAARDAWGRIRSRMKGAADFEPHYEDVPKSPLVRIRIGPVADKGQAIALCAAAAGAGLDCLPVPPAKA